MTNNGILGFPTPSIYSKFSWRKSGDSILGLPQHKIGLEDSDQVVNKFIICDCGFDGYPYGKIAFIEDKILLGGHFSRIRDKSIYTLLARLNSLGEYDDTFKPLGIEDDSYIWSYYVDNLGILVQDDGKILVLVTNELENNYKFLRLNSDGSLDTSFNQNLIWNYESFDYFTTMALQSDGKIIIAGRFTEFVGENVKHIVRLNSNGTIDTSFNMGINELNLENTLNPSVYELIINSVIVQSDDKIIIGGQFTTVAGQTKNHIARLNADGTLDNSFNTGGIPGVSGSGYVTGTYTRPTSIDYVVLQDDNKIIISGSFSEVRGSGRKKIARLNSDATLDASFSADAFLESFVYDSGNVSDRLKIELFSDDKILILAPKIVSFDDTFFILNSDGSLDVSDFIVFNYESSIYIEDFKIKSDDTIFIVGAFNLVNGIRKFRLVKVNKDGSVDTSFNESINVPEDSEFFPQHYKNLSLGFNFLFGQSVAPDKYRGAVLAPNNYLYFIPYQSDVFLKFDIFNNTFTYFGDLSELYPTPSLGDEPAKWECGFLAPNGYIYCVPQRSVASVLKLDPSNDSFEFFGDLPTYNNIFFGHPAMAKNGNIYFSREDDKIYKIDTSCDQVYQIADVALLLEERGFASTAVGRIGTFIQANNGFIYIAPFYPIGVSSSNPTPPIEYLLKLDPENDSITFLNKGLETPFYIAARGGVCAPNGIVYCPPSGYPNSTFPFESSRNILKIDTNNDTVSQIVLEELNDRDYKYEGFVMGSNGMLYAFPGREYRILKFNWIDESYEFLENDVFINFDGNYTNYATGILAPNGKIYGIPQVDNLIVEIDCGNAINNKFCLTPDKNRR